MRPEAWLDRYRNGECDTVWSEMLSLGAAIRGQESLEHGQAVARETMSRARTNVELVVDRLRKLGYRFEHQEKAHVPPQPVHLARLREFEQRFGPLPLSLRFFHELVGTVDFTQSQEQLVQWWPEERRTSASALEVLGEYDPLVVGPLDEDAERDGSRPGLFFVAPDEFHKANYSGGEHYQVALPNPAADFELWPLGTPFVTYLRETFRGGGFWGRLCLDDEDEERAWKERPDLELANERADGLLDL